MSVSSTGSDVTSTPVTVGAVSSSTIVPLAVGSAASCAFDDTPDSVTVKVSSSSSRVSCTVRIEHRPDVPLAVIVAVPAVLDERSAAAAVSPLSIDAVQVTVTSAAAAAVSVSGKSMIEPSVPEAFPTLSVGRVVPSSSSIVPLAVASGMVALDGFDSVTVKVSSFSSAESSVVWTVTVFSSCPASKVSVVADTAVKSVPAVAVSPVSADAAQSTVTVLPLAADSATVKARGSPSVAETSPTLTVGGSSSSLIVPLAVTCVPSCAFDDGLDSVTVKVSFSSSMVSCAELIAHDPDVEPIWIVAVLLSLARSAAAAVSPVSNDAMHCTDTISPGAADSVSGNLISEPSVAEAFPTLSVGRVLAAATALVGALASVFANPPVSVQLAFAVSVAPRSAATTV